MSKIIRDYKRELKNRAVFVKKVLNESGAKGVCLGLSGGKDSALCAAIAKVATKNVLGVMLPCGSLVNFGTDLEDARQVANFLDIDTKIIDLTDVKNAMLRQSGKLSKTAEVNIAPRLRMTLLYAIAQDLGYLVMGTSNKSEAFIGYSTKWGDGAADFNPILDLTATEVAEFLKAIDAPENVWQKAPSAGLFEGQTDEDDFGFTYKELDAYLLNGTKGKNFNKIMHMNKISRHKYKPVVCYTEDNN